MHVFVTRTGVILFPQRLFVNFVLFNQVNKFQKLDKCEMYKIYMTSYLDGISM